MKEAHAELLKLTPAAVADASTANAAPGIPTRTLAPSGQHAADESGGVQGIGAKTPREESCPPHGQGPPETGGHPQSRADPAHRLIRNEHSEIHYYNLYSKLLLHDVDLDRILL